MLLFFFFFLARSRRDENQNKNDDDDDDNDDTKHTSLAHPFRNPDSVTHFCLPGLKSQLAHTIAVYSAISDFAKRILATDFPFPSHQLVFVDEEPSPLVTYAGMSMMSVHLLSSARIIDKTFEARELLARAVMSQYV